MDNWNFDMSQAPRGRTETATRKGRDGSETDYERFVPDFIIAASQDGKTVTVSRWIPEAGRWSMFAKETPPLAWMPYPEHPVGVAS